MTDQDSLDRAAQTRIITHMNADHHDSISRYLSHHHNLSSWTASASRLTSITLTETTYLASGKTYTIPFTPPLKTYRDARPRLVEMDRDARLALGRDEITVKEFVPPAQLFYALEFLIIAATFIAYSQRWWFAPSGPVAGVLGEGFAEFSWRIQPWVFGGMCVIHGVELAVFVPKFLTKHSVDPRSGVWWLWVGSSFIEGQFAWWRFRALVERKREEAGRKKH